MNVRTARDLGLVIRERRRQLRLNQDTLARRVGVSRQWLVEVEKGKPRAEIGLLLRTLAELDLLLQAGPSESKSLPYAIESVNVDDIIERARSRAF